MSAASRLRPVVLDGKNIRRAVWHLRTDGSDSKQFNDDTVVLVVKRLLNLYVSLRSEMQDGDDGFSTKMENLRKSHKNQDTAEFYSELWQESPELPPIYIFLEPEDGKFTKDSLFKRLSGIAFASFLICPQRCHVDGAQQDGKVYGDRLLLDFAATADAIVVSNDKFKDVKNDPLYSELEKTRLDANVVPYFVSSGGEYVYIDESKLKEKIIGKPNGHPSAKFHGAIPEIVDPLFSLRTQKSGGQFRSAEHIIEAQPTETNALKTRSRRTLSVLDCRNQKWKYITDSVVKLSLKYVLSYLKDKAHKDTYNDNLMLDLFKELIKQEGQLKIPEELPKTFFHRVKAISFPKIYLLTTQTKFKSWTSGTKNTEWFQLLTSGGFISLIVLPKNMKEGEEEALIARIIADLESHKDALYCLDSANRNPERAEVASSDTDTLNALVEKISTPFLKSMYACISSIHSTSGSINIKELNDSLEHDDDLDLSSLDIT